MANVVLALAHAKRADLAANDGRDLGGLRLSDEGLHIRPNARRRAAKQGNDEGGKLLRAAALQGSQGSGEFFFSVHGGLNRGALQNEPGCARQDQSAWVTGFGDYFFARLEGRLAGRTGASLASVVFAALANVLTVSTKRASADRYTRLSSRRSTAITITITALSSTR